MVTVVEEDASAVDRVVNALRAGKLVALPCDTVYSLSCDATDPEAVERVFEVKRRPRDKPVSVAVHSTEAALRLLKPVPGLRRALETLTPGPVTLVAPVRPGVVAEQVTAGRDRLGVRIPDHPFFLRVVRRFGRPVVTTSANLSGRPAPVSSDEVIEQLRGGVDLVVDGECPIGEPSTVVELRPDGEIKILREGPLSRDEVLRALRGEVPSVGEG
ncbi:L-threonylcarbamoyladenylate synthase [Methanopyrus sp.]